MNVFFDFTLPRVAVTKEKVCMKFFLFILCFYFILTGYTSYRGSEGVNEPQPLSEGQLIFEEMGCVMCHGHQGMGDGFLAEGLNPKPRNFTSYEEMKLVPYQSMYSAIKDGIPYSAMPAFELSNKQIDAVISYVRSFLTENYITISTCANTPKVVSLKKINIEKPFEVEMDKGDYIEVSIKGDELTLTPSLIPLLKSYKRDGKKLVRVHVNLTRKVDDKKNYLATIAVRVGDCVK